MGVSSQTNCGPFIKPYNSPSLLWVSNIRAYPFTSRSICRKILHSRRGDHAIFGLAGRSSNLALSSSSFIATKQNYLYNTMSSEGKYILNTDFHPASWRRRVMQESNTKTSSARMLPISMDKINSKGYSNFSTLGTEDEFQQGDHLIFKSSNQANWNKEIAKLRNTRTPVHVASDYWTNDTKCVLRANTDTIEESRAGIFPVEVNDERNQHLPPTQSQILPNGIHVKGSSHIKLQQIGEKIIPRKLDVNDGRNQYLPPTQILPNGIHVKGSSHHKLQQVGEKIIPRKLDDLAPKVHERVANTPQKRLLQIYDKVLIVDSISMARRVVKMLTTQFKDCIHACDTEVAKIDVKQETPVDHGEIICFSIYSGTQANFGNGKSCIWVDVLDGGGRNLLLEFAPFFEDPSIKKVWHNYSFDKHIVENYGIKVSGFHADTMHMARLWDSSRRTEGGYSLEALTGDPKVCTDKNLIGKISMKTIFGKNKLKKDGSEGKIITMAPVEELQREERKPWICYSALDSISTLVLYESLKHKLLVKEWMIDGIKRGTMFDFYENYWRPFGDLLVEMESEGMLVDRAYLAKIEKVARSEQRIAAHRFRSWASKHCPDAEYMNIGSDTQLRQLFFGGIQNSKDETESLPLEKEFKVSNVNQVIAEGKKTPNKFVNITLSRLAPLEAPMETDVYTASGWPSVGGDVLRNMAGKVSAEYDCNDESGIDDSESAAYGTAYAAFGGGQEGKEACHSIAALCEVCSIDSLISNFILPLQGGHISGINGRIHCSLNINTETGRLSARRPNLQNQPALEKDRYKIRQAFIASPGNSLIVADYGQLELRILAHLANCKSMLDAFKAGGDFHSRTAMNMYSHIREAVEKKHVLLEWHPQPGQEKPPVPLLKDAFGAERRKAKMLNFSIAYGKTPVGLARDWKVSRKEAKETVERWYNGRQEVQKWQEERKKEAIQHRRVHTLLGRARTFPSTANSTQSHKGHIERAAINTPVQGSAADVAMCAMLEITKNERLKELGWKLLLQVHDEVILEGPTKSAEEAKAIVVHCMSNPFDGKNILKVDLSVDAKCAQNWYAAK